MQMKAQDIAGSMKADKQNLRMEELDLLFQSPSHQWLFARLGSLGEQTAFELDASPTILLDRSVITLYLNVDMYII